MATARTLLSSQIRNLLIQRDRSQTELAKGIGKSQPLVSQVIQGKRGISIDTLDELARFFEVEVSDLFLDATHPDRAPILLTEHERAVLAAFRRADARTRVAIAVLLGVAASDVRVEIDDAQAAETYLQKLADIAHALEGLPLPAAEGQRRLAGGR